MNFLTETNITDILEILTPILTIVSAGVGFGIAKFLEWKKLKQAQKELDIQSHESIDKVENERFRDTVSASQKLSEILITSVKPLAERISMLEQDSMNKQKQILDLSAQVVQLTKTLRDKDLQIDDLKRQYQAQVEISNQQERKIQAQALRIGELEDELSRLKKRKEQQ